MKWVFYALFCLMFILEHACQIGLYLTDTEQEHVSTLFKRRRRVDTQDSFADVYFLFCLLLGMNIFIITATLCGFILEADS